MVDPQRLYACKNCHYLNTQLGACECCGKNVEEQVQYSGIIGICDPSTNSYNYACLKNLIEDTDNQLILIPGIYAININDDEQDQE